MQRTIAWSLCVLSCGFATAMRPTFAEVTEPAATSSCPQPAITTSSNGITPVTTSNYAKAETTGILKDYIHKIASHSCSDGIGVFMHKKAAMDPHDRTILRANFDTLYSFAVVDLSTPATVVLPEAGRDQILEIVSDEHWIPLVTNKPGSYQLTRDNVGSRYAFVLIRTQVNMQDSEDMKAAGAAQDMVQLKQTAKGQFVDDQQFDKNEILALRAEYNKRREPEGITSEMIFGKKGEISSEMRNFGVAIGWGGLPKQGAVYPMPKTISSTDAQTLTLENVPMEAGSFWSVTVYDDKGFATGEHYNVNSAFAKKDENGKYIINLGGSDTQDNFLNIYPGWNATIRIYSPTEDYFNGNWPIPQFQPKN